MENIEKIRHSLSHIMAEVVLEFWPKAKIGMGPAIENGFYYDFEFPTPPTTDDLARIEDRMQEIIRQGQKFEKEEISKIKAKKLFANQKYKLELISELPGKTVTIYTSGNFVDLCKGPHIKSTKEIDINAFKLKLPEPTGKETKKIKC
jgi:threonyl-tRNA synthetase